MSGIEEGDDDPWSDPDEKRAFHSVLDSFRQYRRTAHFNTTHVRRQRFYALPSNHWGFLSKPPFSLLETLSRVDDAIDVNANLAEAILASATATFDPAGANGLEKDIPTNTATRLNLDKARSTIHQLWRDWSTGGSRERSACHDPVFADLNEVFTPGQIASQRGVKVLVPGAGLGRLVFDLAAKNYHVEGNEISYHQLITSSFILNHTTSAEEWTIYPWIMSFSNVRNREDQFEKVAIPDVHPGSSQIGGSMGMTAGDFCTVYQSEEYRDAFDAVATVFFIDTAPNVLTYLTTIKHCLRTGGYWSNVGPLLWHFDGQDQNDEDLESNGEDAKSTKIGQSGSVELSEDEVVKLVESFGFKFINHDVDSIATGYIQNPLSMLQNRYRPSHWLARKEAS